MAFQYSGRKLKWQYTAALGVILLLAVAIGVTYGTSFRNIKGSEARMDAGDYVGQIGATIDYLSNEDPEILVKNSAQALADRVGAGDATILTTQSGMTTDDMIENLTFRNGMNRNSQQAGALQLLGGSPTPDRLDGLDN